MFRFLHAADIHLDSPLKGLEGYEDAPVEEIRGAARRAFDNLVELAVEEEVRFVLLVGDLYDGDWKDYHTGLFFVDRMARLRKVGIRVFIVSGNHDAASQITRTMPLPDNVELFPTRKSATILIEDIGAAIHGQGYSSRAVTENLVSGFPPKDPRYLNIGLLHTALTGRPGHESYAPCTIDDLRSKGYAYWALGHIHQQEIVSEDPWIVFPGNIQGRHIRETGSKGAFLVSVEDEKIVRVEHRALDELRWTLCRADLSECRTADAVHETVGQVIEKARQQAGGRPLAVRLILEGSCPVHADLNDRAALWTEEFRALAAGLGSVWLEKVRFETLRPDIFEFDLAEDAPLAGLLKSVQNMDLDLGRITELSPEIETLKARLPAEVLEAEGFLSNDPESREDLRREVKALLSARLVRCGGQG